jgi:hypothetical protein
MGEPVSVRRRRRLTLSSALRAARAAGLTVKSATTTEDGKVTLVFDTGETVTGTNDDWDRRIRELQDGKR